VEYSRLMQRGGSGSGRKREKTRVFQQLKKWVKKITRHSVSGHYSNFLESLFGLKGEGHDTRMGLKWYGGIGFGWKMVRQLFIILLHSFPYYIKFIIRSYLTT
jgi:hypothetical protein